MSKREGMLEMEQQVKRMKGSCFFFLIKGEMTADLKMRKTIFVERKH